MAKPVATNLQFVGGAAAILGLVAMASDVEGLYAAVKALVCVVKSNPLASKEMERIKGYQVRLGFTYMQKYVRLFTIAITGKTKSIMVLLVTNTMLIKSQNVYSCNQVIPLVLSSGQVPSDYATNRRNDEDEGSSRICKSSCHDL